MGSLLDLALKHDLSVIAPRPTDPEELVLTAAQEAGRREVLARLEAHPLIQRTFTTRWENGALIVTLGIRGVGTGELAISGERMSGGDLNAYSTLLDCLNQSGPAS